MSLIIPISITSLMTDYVPVYSLGKYEPQEASPLQVRGEFFTTFQGTPKILSESGGRAYLTSSNFLNKEMIKDIIENLGVHLTSDDQNMREVAQTLVEWKDQAES